MFAKFYAQYLNNAKNNKKKVGSYFGGDSPE
jgi:hypothetical protein